MTTAQCPVCGAESVDALLCHADTSRLEQALAEVPGLVADLDVTRSKQARIGGGMKGGLASERTPIGWGGVDPRWVLENVLTTWARDVCETSADCTCGHADLPAHFHMTPCPIKVAHLARITLDRPIVANPSTAAARLLLSAIPIIRRHPAVDELVDEITDAVSQARRAIDRPADRVYLGQCLVETPDPEGRQVTCLSDLYARHGASHVKCEVCGITHEVLERRISLLEQASDLLFTVIEAARLIGSYGDLQIRESTIRNYVSSGQIAYHGKVGGSSVIRLGDLLTVIATHAAKPNGRKLVKLSTSRVGS